MSDNVVSIAKTADPVYDEVDKARLLRVFENRENILHCHSMAWTEMTDHKSNKLFSIVLETVEDMTKVNRLMKRILLDTGSIPRVQKFAEVLEKVYHKQFLGMSYAAAEVLSDRGWMYKNIVTLHKKWREIKDGGLDQEPEVVLLRPFANHELQFLVGLFQYFTDPIVDNFTQDICNVGYVSTQESTGCQVSLLQLQGGVADRTTGKQADPIDRHGPSPIDAWREDMNSVITQADFPEPLVKVEVQFEKLEDMKSQWAQLLKMDLVQYRNPSTSSSVCSGMSDVEDVCFYDIGSAQWTIDYQNHCFCCMSHSHI